MSVLQKNQQEIRYIKRQNLDEESKMYQNMYRDIIHNYGIDCKYYKISIPYPEYFKNILSDNNVILHAYGVDADPKYQVSADMLGYMEVDKDVFQLNKYGVVPDMDVSFTFDRTEFASKLAYGLGKLKEFKINSREFNIEVPNEYEHIQYTNENGVPMQYSVTDDLFQYARYVGVPATFECPELNLKGTATFVLGQYELDKEYTVPVENYIHTDGGYSFPVNDKIYRSFYYNVDVKEYLEVMLYMKYKIQETIYDIDTYGNKLTKRILHGNLYGTVLFRDMTKMGKYADLIHPDVGDIVTIDFPDETSREQYEITECYDKNLGQDGLNPLLHKYIWKCKARRYINSGEDSPEYNEANERVMEALDIVTDSEEELVKKISKYDETNNDAAYGGYEKTETFHDIKKVDNSQVDKCDPIFIDDGSTIDIFTFGDTSKLITNGYDLFFKSSSGKISQLTTIKCENGVDHMDIVWVQSGIDYLAATDNAIWFKNFDNEAFRICYDDEELSQDEKEMCLNSLIDTTYASSTVNKNGDMFYKFTNCGTILMSLEGELYCRFGNKSKKIVRLDMV